MVTAYCPSCGRKALENDQYCRGCGGALTDDARAMTPLAEAESLLAQGLLTEAIATVQRALGEHERPDLLVALSTLYLRRGDAVQALRALERAIEIDPDCAAAYAYKGGLRVQQGSVHEAEELLDKALELAPDDLNVRIKRAEYWLRLGVLDRADHEIREGLKNGGGSAETRAAAEMLYVAIQKRREGSFVRAVVPLPGKGIIERVVSRLKKARRNETKLEVE